MIFGLANNHADFISRGDLAAYTPANSVQYYDYIIIFSL